MIREIVKDHFILSQKCDKATREDQDIITDLLDTINAHKETCVGMAAKYDRRKKKNYCCER